MAKKYWLMKSEPESYSIDDLSRDMRTWWDGVRNYQARNFMMKEMTVGDEVLFYHSNAEPPCVAGLARISGPAQPDVTQFDKKSEYFDETSPKDNPRWHCTQVEFIEKFKKPVTLDEIKKHPALKEMLLLQRGQRLSVQPVAEKDFEIIKKLAHGKSK